MESALPKNIPSIRDINFDFVKFKMCSQLSNMTFKIPDIQLKNGKISYKNKLIKEKLELDLYKQNENCKLFISKLKEIDEFMISKIPELFGSNLDEVYDFLPNPDVFYDDETKIHYLKESYYPLYKNNGKVRFNFSKDCKNPTKIFKYDEDRKKLIKIKNEKEID